MRKVKVAAAFFCLLSTGFISGIAANNDVSVARTAQSDQLLELTAEAVTTAASIETTAIVTTCTTEKKTAAVTTQTTAATTTAATTAATVQTAAPETTATETEPLPEETTATEYIQDVQYLAPPVVTDIPVITEPPVTEATAPAETAAAAQEPLCAPSNPITVTDSEYIMLCNVVGHEYGADWIPAEEKALVAEVIMNRVNSPLFPNTIYGVLTQPNQFPGLQSLIDSGTMSRYVTQGVRDAVDLYLAHPEQFQHGYLFFNGDGQRNYFRTGC